MDAHFPVRRGVAELKGRQVECEVLDRLIEAVRQGESRALVLRVEPGVGKTALLDYLAEHASGCVVARAAGVQSEMELAFAGLQQLCAPMLDHLQRLPHPQRDALGVALGIGSGVRSHPQPVSVGDHRHLLGQLPRAQRQRVLLGSTLVA